MNKVNSSAKSVMAKDVNGVAGNTNTELKRIWNKLNELSTALNNINQGMQNNESKGSFRFVESGDNRYLEARFKDGWTRLNSTFELITKKE